MLYRSFCIENISILSTYAQAEATGSASEGGQRGGGCEGGGGGGGCPPVQQKSSFAIGTRILL